MAPFAVVFLPVGIFLLYFGTAIVQDRGGARSRWLDMNERRRALMRPPQKPYSDDRALTDGYVLAALGVAFVIGGLSLP